MTDTRKEFERAVSNLGWAFDYIGDGQYGSHTIQFANKLWQSCQNLNDKRMLELIQQNNDLLAVIAKKDEALKSCVDYSKYEQSFDAEKVATALALHPADVELADIGYISEDGMEVFLAMGLPLDAETCGVPVTKLYTIKQKDLS